MTIEPAAQEIRPQELGEGFILLGIAADIAQGARQTAPRIVDQLRNGLGHGFERLALAIAVVRIGPAPVLHDEPKFRFREDRKVRQLADQDCVLAIVGQRPGKMMMIDDIASLAGPQHHRHDMAVQKPLSHPLRQRVLFRPLGRHLAIAHGQLRWPEVSNRDANDMVYMKGHFIVSVSSDFCGQRR